MNAEHDIPAPPDDLRERCLETAPVVDAHFALSVARKRRSRTVRLSLTALAVAGFGFWLTRPVSHVRNAATTVSGDVAFAETLQAMRRVTYYHSTGKSIGFDPDGGKDGKTWYSGAHWIESERWFDAERGNRRSNVLLPNSAYVAIQESLELPDGSCTWRIGSRVKITQFGARHWKTIRNSELLELTNICWYGRGFDYPRTPPPYLKTTGTWKGRRVTQFLFDASPSAVNAAHGAPAIHTSLYVDPYSKLIIAQQQFAHWPNHPERGEKLVLENEQDYDRPADAAKFDISNVTAGAETIQRARYAPGIDLMPDRVPGD